MTDLVPDTLLRLFLLLVRHKQIDALLRDPVVLKCSKCLVSEALDPPITRNDDDVVHRLLLRIPKKKISTHSSRKMNIVVDEIIIRGIQGAALAKIRCPYCRRKHSHGLGIIEHPVLGQRMAHCGKGSYILVEDGSGHEIKNKSNNRNTRNKPKND